MFIFRVFFRKWGLWVEVRFLVVKILSLIYVEFVVYFVGVGEGFEVELRF